MGWFPITNVLSYLVNLVSLCLSINVGDKWNPLGNISLPVLKILKTENIQPKILVNLIENTKGGLTQISIYLMSHDDVDNKRIIQAIYLNCPNLKYLGILIKNSNISEFEKLLINCQYLIGLSIIDEDLVWDNLLETLTKSSPAGLFKFKFKFTFIRLPKSSLDLFVENWKGRRPILMQVSMLTQVHYIEYLDLGRTKLRCFWYGNIMEDFE